jgi:hypothetical protein
MLQKQKQIIILAIISIILFYIIIQWSDYLSNNFYIIFTENFQSNSNVDLSLTNTNDCSNFCGANATCAISKQQCITDIDCNGCQTQHQNQPNQKHFLQNILGENDAGKMTFGITPQYSSLTNGYGTKEKIITNNLYSKPPTPNFGINTWYTNNQNEQQLFNERYKPSIKRYIPTYTNRYTLTGAFIEDGPLPSNAYI